jgi:predicted ATPase
MNKPLTIALTGGPGGGKTTSINYLKQTPADYYFIPEAATIILEGGYPNLEQNTWTPAWQEGLQLAVAGLQKGLELIAQERAQGQAAIVCDRGMLDSAAYLENPKSYEPITGETQAKSLERYDAVIFLHSFAKINRYKKDTNRARFEDARQAIVMNDRLLEAWKEHPNLIEIDIPTLPERCSKVATIITDLTN